MYPHWHFILGITFASAILFLFPESGLIGFALILASTVLIDVDHYLEYVIRNRDISLKNAYRWFSDKFHIFKKLPRKEKEKFKREIMVFHGFEFLVFLGAIALFFEYFYYIFLGISFHLFLDYLALAYYSEPVYFKTSQFYTFIKNKNRPEFEF